MDINTSSLAHLAFGASLNGGLNAASTESTQDAAAWFHGDASGARITVSTSLPDAADVATLAQRVLAHLTA